MASALLIIAGRVDQDSNVEKIEKLLINGLSVVAAEDKTLLQETLKSPLNPVQHDDFGLQCEQVENRVRLQFNPTLEQFRHSLCFALSSDATTSTVFVVYAGEVCASGGDWLLADSTLTGQQLFAWMNAESVKVWSPQVENYTKPMEKRRLVFITPYSGTGTGWTPGKRTISTPVGVRTMPVEWCVETSWFCKEKSSLNIPIVGDAMDDLKTFARQVFNLQTKSELTNDWSKDAPLDCALSTPQPALYIFPGAGSSANALFALQGFSLLLGGTYSQQSIANWWTLIRNLPKLDAIVLQDWTALNILTQQFLQSLTGSKEGHLLGQVLLPPLGYASRVEQLQGVCLSPPTSLQNESWTCWAKAGLKPDAMPPALSLYFKLGLGEVTLQPLAHRCGVVLLWKNALKSDSVVSMLLPTNQPSGGCSAQGVTRLVKALEAVKQLSKVATVPAKTANRTTPVSATTRRPTASTAASRAAAVSESPTSAMKTSPPKSATAPPRPSTTRPTTTATRHSTTASTTARPATATTKPTTPSTRPSSTRPSTTSMRPATATSKPSAPSTRPGTAPSKPKAPSSKPTEVVVEKKTSTVPPNRKPASKTAPKAQLKPTTAAAALAEKTSAEILAGGWSSVEKEDVKPVEESQKPTETPIKEMEMNAAAPADVSMESDKEEAEKFLKMSEMSPQDEGLRPIPKQFGFSDYILSETVEQVEPVDLEAEVDVLKEDPANLMAGGDEFMELPSKKSPVELSPEEPQQTFKDDVSETLQDYEPVQEPTRDIIQLEQEPMEPCKEEFSAEAEIYPPVQEPMTDTTPEQEPMESFGYEHATEAPEQFIKGEKVEEMQNQSEIQEPTSDTTQPDQEPMEPFKDFSPEAAEQFIKDHDIDAVRSHLPAEEPEQRPINPFKEDLHTELSSEEPQQWIQDDDMGAPQSHASIQEPESHIINSFENNPFAEAAQEMLKNDFAEEFQSHPLDQEPTTGLIQTEQELLNPFKDDLYTGVSHEESQQLIKDELAEEIQSYPPTQESEQRPLEPIEDNLYTRVSHDEPQQLIKDEFAKEIQSHPSIQELERRPLEPFKNNIFAEVSHDTKSHEFLETADSSPEGLSPDSLTASPVKPKFLQPGLEEPGEMKNPEVLDEEAHMEDVSEAQHEATEKDEAGKYIREPSEERYPELIQKHVFAGDGGRAVESEKSTEGVFISSQRDEIVEEGALQLPPKVSDEADPEVQMESHKMELESSESHQIAEVLTPGSVESPPDEVTEEPEWKISTEPCVVESFPPLSLREELPIEEPEGHDFAEPAMEQTFESDVKPNDSSSGFVENVLSPSMTHSGGDETEQSGEKLEAYGFLLEPSSRRQVPACLQIDTNPPIGKISPSDQPNSDISDLGAKDEEVFFFVSSRTNGSKEVVNADSTTTDSKSPEQESHPFPDTGDMDQVVHSTTLEEDVHAARHIVGSFGAADSASPGSEASVDSIVDMRQHVSSTLNQTEVAKPESSMEAKANSPNGFLNNGVHQASTNSTEKANGQFDASEHWGPPMGLPPPNKPVNQVKTAPANKNANHNSALRAASNSSRPSTARPKTASSAPPTLPPGPPVFLDVVWVPAYLSSAPQSLAVEFFARVRARSYVLSGAALHPSVGEALIAGKAKWDASDVSTLCGGSKSQGINVLATDEPNDWIYWLRTPCGREGGQTGEARLIQSGFNVMPAVCLNEIEFSAGPVTIRSAGVRVEL